MVPFRLRSFPAARSKGDAAPVTSTNARRIKNVANCIGGICRGAMRNSNRFQMECRSPDRLVPYKTIQKLKRHRTVQQHPANRNGLFGLRRQLARSKHCEDRSTSGDALFGSCRVCAGPSDIQKRRGAPLPAAVQICQSFAGDCWKCGARFGLRRQSASGDGAFGSCWGVRWSRRVWKRRDSRSAGFPPQSKFVNLMPAPPALQTRPLNFVSSPGPAARPVYRADIPRTSSSIPARVLIEPSGGYQKEPAEDTHTDWCRFRYSHAFQTEGVGAHNRAIPTGSAIGWRAWITKISIACPDPVIIGVTCRVINDGKPIIFVSGDRYRRKIRCILEKSITRYIGAGIESPYIGQCNLSDDGGGIGYRAKLAHIVNSQGKWICLRRAIWSIRS